MNSESPQPQPDPFKYWAFICYSHSDEKWATWLHRKLETYRVPQRLVGKLGDAGVIIPKRAFPIFRDREELPGSANLTESIERALRESLYLIVICSPRAVKSKWVDQEIRMFKAWDREDRVLCLVVEGEPNAASNPALGKPECLPESVKFWVDANRQITQIPTEPIAADARKGKDGRQNGFLKIAAGILGVSFEDLRQRDEERRHKLRMTYSAAAAALVILLGGLSIELFFQEKAAVQAMQQARKDRVMADEQRRAADQARKDTQRALEQQQVATQQAQEAAVKAERAAAAESLAKLNEEAERKRVTEALALAKKAEEKARESEVIAKESEERISRTLAFADFASASRLLEDDSDGKALAYLSRALRADPHNQSVITRTLSLLLQRNWPLQVVPPLRHDAEVKSVMYSPDGSKLVTVSQNAARVWNSSTGVLSYPPLEHKGQIFSAEFSPDGKWLVTASRDNTAQIWDLTTGKPAGSPLKHDDFVYSASFSADGKLVVTGSQDKIARVWERATGRVVISLQHDGPVKSARFSPDGNWVLVANLRSYARLWDITSGAPVGANMTHQGGLTSAVFSPDGKWIATAGDWKARLWLAGAGSPVSPPLDHVDWINGAKFSPDGKCLATVSKDNTARIWEVPAGKPVTPPLKHDGPISSVNFSPNGRWLVTASADGTARVWNTTSGKPVCEPLRHTGNVFEAVFSPEGDKVVTASSDRTARVWSVADHRPLSEPLQHDQWVNAAAFSADGKVVATVSADRCARIWNAISGEAMTGPLKHRGEVVTCCIANQGKTLLTGCSDGTVSAWDVPTERLLFERLDHEVRVNNIQVADGNTTFFTSSDDHTVRHWKLATGEPIGPPLRHDTSVKTFTMSTDGKYLATASQDRRARVWDSAGTELFELEHRGEVQCLAISPDGQWLATGAEDSEGNCVRIWDLKTGKLLLENLRHDAAVSILAFTSASQWNDTHDPKKWLLTISDKTARVWDLASHKPVTEPLKHSDPIKAAAFSPDGNFFATACDKTARIWDASTGRAVCDPVVHDGAIRFVAFSPDGNSFITTSADKTAQLSFLRMSGETPGWLSEFATAIGGYHLADSGATELVQSNWAKLTEIKELAAADPNPQFATWARWFSEPLATRTTTPFTKTSLNAFVLRRIYEGSPASLQQALDLQPNNALALVKLARITPNADQADFLSGLAEHYAPLDPNVLWIRAQVLQQVYKTALAYAVMERAIALDSRNTSVFTPQGNTVRLQNKDGCFSEGWLPNGWLDNNAALAVSVSYSKVNDLPDKAPIGFGINVDARSKTTAELRGPRLICKRNSRCTIEGWVRSALKSDLTLALCQFLEPSDKLKEQTIRTTPEWKPFKFQFVPQQDTAAELRIYQFAGASVEIAGITVKGD